MKIMTLLCLSFLTQFSKAEMKPAQEKQPEVTDQIKSCLIDLYVAQLKYFEINDAYSASKNELKLHDMVSCKGVEVSFEVVNRETFTIGAQLKDQRWTLDDGKSLTRIH